MYPGPVATIIICAVIVAACLLLWPTVSNRHRRFRRMAARALDKVQAMESPSLVLPYLRRVNPYVFEELLLTCWERQGYHVVRNRAYSGDGGIDGRVFLNGKLHLVQAKRYRKHVKLEHVRDFAQVCRQRGYPGLFVHTGRTGAAVKEFLASHPEVKVLSGSRLVQFLQRKA